VQRRRRNGRNEGETYGLDTLKKLFDEVKKLTGIYWAV
jgi:hypothetical protein